MTEYKQGQKVRYETVSNGALTVWEGMINGEPMDIDGHIYVPVWSKRDRGREPTTIIVHADNILEDEDDH